MIYLTGFIVRLGTVSKAIVKIQSSISKYPPNKKHILALEGSACNFLIKSKDKDQGRVVRVTLGKESNFSLMGLLTSTTLKREATQIKPLQSTFPVSYQIGGYTIFVSPEQVEYVDMSVEDLMKSALTAWIKVN